MLLEFLANCIWLFHVSVIVFVIFAPFTQIPAILILHITFAVCLLMHWYTNSNACSLTILESYLRGLPPDSTFMHQLISPIYDISSTDLNYLVHIVTYLTLILSIYYLYNNTKFQETMECYTKLKEKSFTNVMDCFTSLFIF